eukprot:CAMPEP_0171312416 /NCGR_PEP_ID=MMETSP0816-20121228/22663_1 /TAXON_ID=420281 /ORGANISM="Proboscia inermis, Strain CCAP1064/1" /LENGTH=63 /DNA_ID=CAMNT_0011797769 /DNA_START=1355 /DNA_END=1546 /DNA_ORIENTATION=+
MPSTSINTTVTVLLKNFDFKPATKQKVSHGQATNPTADDYDILTIFRQILVQFAFLFNPVVFF